MKLSLFLLLIFVNTVSSQTLVNNKSKGDSLRNIGNLVLAKKEYIAEYKKDTTQTANAYNCAIVYALRNEPDSAFYYLDIYKKGQLVYNVLTDPSFYFLINDKRWDEFVDAILEKVEAKKGKFPDIKLTKSLLKLKLIDQAFYYQLNLNRDFNPSKQAIWELKRLLNNQNLTSLDSIIIEHGWPKKSQINFSVAEDAAFLVVQHANLGTQKKYLQIFKNAVEINEASPANLAYLIDRVNLREGKKQIYGSQMLRDNNNEFQYESLEEPEFVNFRRKQVGLGPIEEYLSIGRITFKIEQKTK